MADFVQLLWLFNSPTWKKIETPQPRETRNIIRLDLHEAGLLYKYARLWRDDNDTILEIGRYWAGSTVLLALATHGSNVKVISVDVGGVVIKAGQNAIRLIKTEPVLDIRQGSYL